jgi:hypothetical protein
MMFFTIPKMVGGNVQVMISPRRSRVLLVLEKKFVQSDRLEK